MLALVEYQVLGQTSSKNIEIELEALEDQLAKVEIASLERVELDKIRILALGIA